MPPLFPFPFTIGKTREDTLDVLLISYFNLARIGLVEITMRYIINTTMGTL